MLATQLALPRRYGPSTDVVVATITAGVAALQALAFLDGADPAAVDGTLELRLPDWRVRRRSWTPHPSCDCGLARSTTPAAARVTRAVPGRLTSRAAVGERWAQWPV